MPSSPGGSPLLYSAVTHVVDENGNDTQTSEYNWTSGAPPHDANGLLSGLPSGASLARTVQSAYQSPTPTATSGQVDANATANAYWKPGSPNLLSLRTRSVTSAAGAGSDYAAAEYVYDNGSATAGNVTERRKWSTGTVPGGAPVPLTGAAAILEDFTYGPRGNMLTATDGRSIVTKYNWDFNNLFLTSIVRNFGGSPSRTATFDDRDSSTLLLKKWHDDNNVVTKYDYDAIGRLTFAANAFGATMNGTGFERDKNITYHDDSLRVTVKDDLKATKDQLLTSVTAYDQLGRMRLSKQMQNGSQLADNDTDGIKVQTRYAYGNGVS